MHNFPFRIPPARFCGFSNPDRLDDSTDGQWITSLYLAGVCIYSIQTSEAEEGRKKIALFMEALQMIAALRPIKKIGILDVLTEAIFYL
jgi:hypothetical protein